MKKSKNSLALIDQIEKTKEFHLLDQLIDPKNWEMFQSEDRNRLAELFLKRGERLLQDDDFRGLEALDIAAKVAPLSKEILYQQAASHIQFFDIGGDVSLAIASLETLVEIDPTFVEAWCLLAEAYLLQGQNEDDYLSFGAAQEVFIRGHEALKKTTVSLFPRFFWQWGRCLVSVGHYSEEPEDYYQAIKKYELAINYGIKTEELYFDYGNALIDLGFFIGRQELIKEAINWYQKAEAKGDIATRTDFSYRLAMAFKTYYLISDEAEYFEKAHHYFEKALVHYPEDDHLFQKWGELLMTCGKREKNPQLIESSFVKFDQACKFSEHPEEVYISWAEALMTVGSYSENIDCLKDAYNKLSFASMLIPDHPRLWYLLGSCLNEMGLYFHDHSYFLEATEKFQQGISLDRSNPKLWWGLANSTYYIGEIQMDITLIEKSIRYYTQVIEFFPEGFPSFWNDWGVAFMKLAEFTNNQEVVELAVERFDHAIKQHMLTSSEMTIEPEWMYNLGCSLDFLGDLTLDPTFYEQSIAILSKVLMLEPEFPFARYNLALALTHLGEITCNLECFHRAQEIFEQLAEEDPEDDFVWNDWGVLLIHYSEFVKDPAHPERASNLHHMAEDKLNHATQLGSIHSLYNLACLYSLTGDTGASLNYLERAEESGAIPPLSDLKEDDWLENVRQEDQFQVFISLLEQKEDHLS
ncbi:hypothetical protein N9Y92_03075 [Chlamydiales bacterium]|nr:hypothetical protein [Chlamydiales bacterium]